jgi:hypothetical protein
MRTTLRDFSNLGREAQEMIISQLSAIDLDRIGPKSIAQVGKSLIRLISQSHHFQEEVEDEETKKNWLAVREMSLTILEEILCRYQKLSDQAEIAEWDRSAVLGMLADISKVCHDEQARNDEKFRESAGKEFSNELLREILGNDGN